MNKQNTFGFKDEQTLINRDRMRYQKNKISSSLTYLCILFNVACFISLYKTNNNNFYVPLMGVSVVYNLLFMLFSFLCSEGVKNYKMSFSFILFVIAAFQIARIFYWPTKLLTAVDDEGVLLNAMAKSQFVRIVIYLIGSALFAVIAGIVGLVKTIRLKAFLHKVEMLPKN